MSIAERPGEGLIEGRHPSSGDQESARPHVIDLREPEALEAGLAGAKAAALARAASAGLPVLPGVVLTTASRGSGAADDVAVLYERAAGMGDTLIVRSSSTAEDSSSTAMAGAFESVLGISGRPDFDDAVRRVLDSAATAPIDGDGEMAVLVQPQLTPDIGGVMFGIDPITGADHRVLTAVTGGPHVLVSGEERGSRFVITRKGKVLESDTSFGPSLSRSSISKLLALIDSAETEFGAPQDIEWAISGGELYLLQSRPVTAVGATAAASGPLLGPGPVAETFPDPLSELEVDLWVTPLADALVEALAITGLASRRVLRRERMLEVVGGRVAANLGLMGLAPRSFISKIDPRPAGRRLLASWRVGRLRTALPPIAADVVAEVDDQLSSLPPLTMMSDAELLLVLRRSRAMLMSLNGYEILAGLLVPVGATGETAAAGALRALHRARTEGTSDGDIAASHPEVLALIPPAISDPRPLPGVVGPVPGEGSSTHPMIEARESLRLRVRWIQELTSRIASAFGRRLQEKGVLSDAGDVAWLTLAELETACRGGMAPRELPARKRSGGPPLPSAFRLAPGRVPVAVRTKGSPSGRAAGGGRGEGVVAIPAAPVPPGSVLVVRTLDPQLASLLPGLSGLVAETGSVLSHLAIMAREFGVPTVVGVDDATTLFPAGSHVLVDGDSGEVLLMEGER